MRQSRIAILFALALLVGISIGAGALIVHAFPPPPDSFATVDGPVVVRLYFRDRGHLDAVAGELDIWQVHPDANNRYVVAAVTPAQYRWFESLGYRLEIDAEKTALLTPTASLDHRFYFFDNYYTNTDGRYVVDFLQKTNADYPDLTELDDIGDAWMAGQPDEYDRDIWVLRITNEDPAYGDVADKPAFFLFATIHAREVAVPELAIRYIKYLTTGYGGEGGYDQDADVTWLVNHNVAYVLVMQNPDGHWKNEQDANNYRRKNMDWDDGCSSPGSWGVDLNRNHSFLWGCCGGSSGDPCSETYRGPARGSEPETEYFENYFDTVMRDQNGPNGDDEIPPAAPITTTGIFISLHSYSDLVLWPWAFDDFGDPPNYAQLRTIGRKFAYYNGYNPMETIWYDVDGATDDWTYGKFGIPSYTFEVGSSGGSCGGFFPAYGCIDGIDGMPRNFWAENGPAFLYAHKIARTPYVTAYGPDAHNLSAVPNGVFQGAPVQLTATIADHRYTGDTLQPVAAAEYYIDVPPWVTTTEPISYTMTAADGAFDDTIEDVEATLDTIGLSLGRHIIFVRGRDANRNWGPFTAVFLNVTDGAVAGVVRDDATGTPIDQAEVGLFGGFFDQSTITGPDGAFHFDAYSGTYTLTATAYGYHPVTVTNVVAATGVTTTWTISLTALSVGILTGRVTQANTELPLAATISATSCHTVLETASDPATGLYSLVAFSDTYTLTARSSGHVSVTVPGVIVIQGQTTTQDLILQPHVQLQLDKTAAPAWVFPGDLLTYTLTLTNSGAVSATHVVITDALPTGATFAWASGGGVLTDSVVAWNAPTVFPQETLSRTLVVTVTGAPTGTPLVNATYGARSDQSLSPVWGQPVTVTALCNASLTGVDFAWMPDTLYPGAPVTFTAVVTGGVLVLPDGTLTLPVTYVWDLGDESLPVTGNPITHAYPMAGDYTATLSVTNVCHVASLVACHLIVVDTFFFPHHFYLPLLLRGVGG